MKQWKSKGLVCIFLLGNLMSPGHADTLCEKSGKECKDSCSYIKPDKSTTAKGLASAKGLCAKACEEAEKTCDLSASHKLPRNDSCRDGFDECEKACGFYPQGSWSRALLSGGNTLCATGCKRWKSQCQFNAARLHADDKGNHGCFDAEKVCVKICAQNDLPFDCDDACGASGDACYNEPQEKKKCDAWKAECQKFCNGWKDCEEGCSKTDKDCVSAEKLKA